MRDAINEEENKKRMSKTQSLQTRYFQIAFREWWRYSFSTDKILLLQNEAHDTTIHDECTNSFSCGLWNTSINHVGIKSIQLLTSELKLWVVT
jgi:hypothetical protein